MSRPVDITGQVFGRLTVLRPAPKGERFGESRWFCRCECGTEVRVRTHALKFGNTRSCGCKRRVDLAGQTFGKLTVLERDFSRKAAGTCWLCHCSCGNQCVVQGIRLYKGKTTNCGCGHRRALVTEKFTDTDAAYAAGFFDGEGAVMIWRQTKSRSDSNGRRYHRLHVSVRQTSIEPLKWLAQRFAGTITPIRLDRSNPKNAKSKDAWVWVLSSARAAEFLKAIRPFVVLKQERIDLALRFQATAMKPVRTGGKGWQKITPELWAQREAMREKLMLLNKRGIA